MTHIHATLTNNAHNNQKQGIFILQEGNNFFLQRINQNSLTLQEGVIYLNLETKCGPLPRLTHILNFTKCGFYKGTNDGHRIMVYKIVASQNLGVENTYATILLVKAY